jgi:NAD(P)-dependent dehydrogenase (short-subunit alcohol dehydrogenase family)
MKVALVTGGTKGIGLAVVEALLKQGFGVATCARSAEDLAVTESALGASGLVTVQADLAIEADCRRVVQETASAFGRLDAVVNNAGIYLPGPLAEVPAADWDLTMAVNLRAPYLVAQAAFPHLSAAGGGSIVNIASTNGLMSEPTFAAYNASKAGLISLTETMAVEWASSGIRVNAIAPGWIRTPLSEPWLDGLSQDQLDSLFPMGRVGAADEVGSLAAYLCSDGCGYLTGATVRVDGGMLAKHPGL